MYRDLLITEEVIPLLLRERNADWRRSFLEMSDHMAASHFIAAKLLVVSPRLDL
jgi:hypothetical protein